MIKGHYIIYNADYRAFIFEDPQSVLKHSWTSSRLH